MIDPGKPFYENWQFWWQTLMMIGIAGNWIYSWWTSREKVTARRFADLEKEVTQRVTNAALEKIDERREALCLLHLERTSKLEMLVAQNRSDITHLPGHDNLNKIHGRVDAVQKELSTMNGRLEGIGHTVNLINEFLIREGKR